MSKVKVEIEVEMSDRLFHAYEREAERTGKEVDQLIERLVNDLILEMERDAHDPPRWV